MHGRQPTNFILAKTIANRLKSARARAGNLTQDELSREAGLSKIVGHIEIADRLPDLQTLIKLADVLNCSLDFLCGRTDV